MLSGERFDRLGDGAAIGAGGGARDLLSALSPTFFSVTPAIGYARKIDTLIMFAAACGSCLAIDPVFYWRLRCIGGKSNADDPGGVRGARCGASPSIGAGAIPADRSRRL